MKNYIDENMRDLVGKTEDKKKKNKEKEKRNKLEGKEKNEKNRVKQNQKKQITMKMCVDIISEGGVNLIIDIEINIFHYVLACCTYEVTTQGDVKMI